MRIAVVRNRENAGVIARFGRPSPEVYGRQSVQRIIDALREGGHDVGVFEGDMTMMPGLKEFFAVDASTGAPDGSQPAFIAPVLVNFNGFNTNPGGTYDPWLAMNDDPQTIEPLLALAERDAANGLLDAPWPPVYPKMPNEPPRVAPSRKKKDGA